MKISEAYATLGSPQKRERYDREIASAQSRRSRQTPRGSHSSASTPFGSRPASGLSRRRTQFKGPPPSFYQSGGRNAHGAKRQPQGQGFTNPHSDPSVGSSKPGGGFGPGQGQAGFSNDVPHFDHMGHYRTQQSQEQRWITRKRGEVAESSNEGTDVLLKFVIVGTVVCAAFSVPLWIMGGRNNHLSRAKDKIYSG